MALLDPSIATAAYLAQLPPAVRLAARLHTEQAHWQGAAGGALAILIFWFILKTGLLPRLRLELERDAPRPWLAAAVCTASFLALSVLLMLPWTVFVAWRSNMAKAGAAFDALDFAVATMRLALPLIIIAAAGMTCLLAVVRKAPRTWWIWCGAVAGPLMIAIVWLPYALAAGPAALPVVPPGPVRDGLVQLIRDTGLPARQIYLNPVAGMDANVAGTPAGAQVWISRGMLESASPAEVRAGVAHLIGHFRAWDELSMAILVACLVAGGIYAVHRLYPATAILMGGRELRGLADPAALPVIGVILVVWLALSGVAFNTFDRLVNVRADQYSLDHALEPDGLASSLVRDWRADKVDPGPLEEAIFYDHPSLQNRVLHAMTWKAAHAKP